jgi:hypothetical protein
MPTRHVKDMRAVSRHSWYELTEGERQALVEAVASMGGGVETSWDDLSLADGVGPGALPGTVLRIPVFSPIAELPDEYYETLEAALIESGTAHSVQDIKPVQDPAGEIFEPTDEHGLGYRAVLRVQADWQTRRKVEH